MNRSHPTNFAICFLLLLSAMSVVVTIIFLFYSSVFYTDVGIMIHEIEEIHGSSSSVLPKFESNDRNIIKFVDFDYKENKLRVTDTNNNSEPSWVFSTNQKDKRLWEYIRKQHLTKPSNNKYNFSAKRSIHPNQFSRLIYKLFKQRNGFFVEAGAFDGEAASNSLYLEERGWQGLLVECNPIVLPKLMSKNRKAWISDVCLSLTNTPEKLNFSTPVDWPASAKLGKPLNAKEMKKIGIDWMKNKTWLEYQIPCFPLYSIIKAVGVFKQIDFLSLDVEGSEIAILKHFPFNKIRVKVIIVEVLSYTEEEKTDLDNYLLTKGYDLIKTMENDQLYVHRFAGLNLSGINVH